MIFLHDNIEKYQCDISVKCKNFKGLLSGVGRDYLNAYTVKGNVSEDHFGNAMNLLVVIDNEDFPWSCVGAPT